MNLSDQQIQNASLSMLDYFRLETTLVPGNYRQQVAVFEMVLSGIVNGALVVVPAKNKPVESKPASDDGAPNEPDQHGAEQESSATVNGSRARRT
jgi:hypothetical protein